MRAGAAAPAARRSALQQFTEGFAYAFGFRPIRSIILLLAIVSLVGVPYSVLMPVFATTVFHGGPHTLGILMTSSGCGALLGALWLAQRRSVVGLGRVIPMASALFGAGLIAFSFTHVLWLAIPCLVVAGFGFMVQMASSNTVIQTIVDDEKRGRVMSFYMMAFLGTAPFGSLHRRLAVVAHRGGAHAAGRRRVLHSRGAVVCERAAGDPRRPCVRSTSGWAFFRKWPPVSPTPPSCRFHPNKGENY